MNGIQSTLKERIIALCTIMSVSGFEKRSDPEIRAMYGNLFDEIKTDAVGNRILIKRSGKENAPLCLVDAHFDEVGMISTEVLDGGFVRFSNIGGVSLAILQAADVIIYGSKPIRGIITSTPPHLRSGDDGELSDMDALLIDTGYSKETLEKIAPIGSPIGFAPHYTEMLGGAIVGKSFDDKACAAICLEAVADVPANELECDVAVMLSAFEETSRLGGVATGVFALAPDYAMTVDVNLGRVPDTPKYETVPLYEGVSIAISAATDRKLSVMTKELCKENNIPHTMVAAPSSTGTNATTVNLVGEGVPVVDIGLPLKNMHTYNEVISLDDCESLYRTVRAFVTSKNIANAFKRSGKELPV